MPHLHHVVLGSSGSVLLTLILIIIATVYLRGWFQLRSTSFSIISGWRAFSFGVGLFLIWIAVSSPIASLDHELLTVHMLQHLLLMTLAPPLIWLGEPARSLLHGLPHRFLQRVIGPVSGQAWLQILGKSLSKPQVCWLAAAAALVGWHIPGAFTLGMQSEAWHMVEQGSFFITGLLFWWPVVQPWPSILRPDLSMILYLFFATLPCDVLSGFLVFCDRVVYPIYFSSSHLLGFSALGDQQCAAALMWTGVTVVYLLAGAVLTMHLLSPQSSREHVVMQSVLRGRSVLTRVQSLEALQHGD
jgi:putative membrane protein